MRRCRPRKKIINIRQSGGWNHTGTASSSGPSYESFTIPTPRDFPSKEVTTTTPGKSHPVDVSVVGRKRSATDGEKAHESTSSGPGKNESESACQHSLDGGVSSTRPGVKQIVVRLSGLRPAYLGGEPVKAMGTEPEFHRDVWSNGTECSQDKPSIISHSMNCNHPDFHSAQDAKPTVRILHQALQTPEEIEPKKEPVETKKEDPVQTSLPPNGENLGGTLGSLAPIAESGLPAHDLPGRNYFPHPATPSWMPNANLCRSCPSTTFSTTSQPANGCNACAGGTRFTSAGCSFARGVPRMQFEGPVMYAAGAAAQTMKQPSVDIRGRNLVHPPHGHTCMPGDDHILVCPAPWVHKGRLFPGVPAMCVDQQKYEVNWAPPENECHPIPTEEISLREMPDPVFPPAHNFSTDMDMDTQRQLEEQIAHEILLLSQKLANLQSRYGSRRLVNDNTKPAVLSCPQTPLLLDNSNTQRDIKSSNAHTPSLVEDMSLQRPATSSSSKSTTHRQPDFRSQIDERKLGNRHIGSHSSRRAPSIASSRGVDSRTTIAFNKNHPSSRGSFVSNNNTVRAAEAALVQRWGRALRDTVQVGKSSNKSRIFTRRGRELVDECSYSDDMKEHLRIGGAHVQGYPDGSKRFDWVKTLRFGGVSVRENPGCADFASQMDSKPSTPQKEFTDVDAETWLRDSSEHEVVVVPTFVSKSVQAGGAVSPEGRVDACPFGLEVCELRAKRRPDSSAGKFVCRSRESQEEVGGLDSRLAHHLVKAGLRRAPSFWRVPGVRLPVPSANLKLKKKTFGSRSPRKDGGKRLRRKTLFDPNCLLPEVAAQPKVEENGSALKVERIDEATECAAVGDYEAEYETFVENTSEVGLQNHNLDCEEEYTSVVNREALTSHEKDGLPTRKSPSNCMEKCKLSESPVVSLTKQPPQQATKKTFIRCIELVVATKKPNQVLSKWNGRQDSRYNSHRRIVDCLERPTVGIVEMEREKVHVVDGKHATAKTNGHHS